VKSIVVDAIDRNSDAVDKIKGFLGDWMLKSEIVRIVGAGRALLAASLPGNRLAHGGALVSILSDRSPLPNSRLGGAIIAVNVSGKSEIVLEIMELTQG
jgi:D-arabinose 5-phosphate isomerase GutQ